MNHQDWKPVVLSKSNRPGKGASGAAKSQSLASAQRSGNLTSEKKFAAGGNKSAHQPIMNARKLEEETDELRHNRVDRSLSQAIQQARIAKKLSQKQLATQMSEKPQVVVEYESGKAIPSPAILSKMERVLGTRLPRPSHKK